MNTRTWIAVALLILSGLLPPGSEAADHDAALRDAMERLLRENPEWVLSALEDRPVALVELIERAGEIRKARIEEDHWRRQLENPRVPAIEPDRAIRGARTAPVTIVEYSDFQCPYCQAASRTLRKILTERGDEVRLVYKHIPLPFHAAAEPAARYFEAIALQSEEQAWRFHDRVFERQESLSSGEEALREIAAGLELDQARLGRDLQSNAVTERLQRDQAEAERFGFSGTPSFLINGIELIGNQSAEDFERVIELVAPERHAAAR
jgi:predicted DsbA family dithiol-disulfide isomerase